MVSSLQYIDQLQGCDAEDDLSGMDWVQPGCGTAALRGQIGLNSWGESVERVALANILREFLRDRAEGGLRDELAIRSIWDLPREEPIIGYLIERMGWIPSGVEPRSQLEVNLRAAVEPFEASGELTEYARDWIRLQSRGW